MERIKAGVIGAGFVGPLHVEALRRLGYVEVVALAGSSAERGREAAEKLSIERSYGSYQELLSDPDVRVIHNCTPNKLHYAINRAALQAGKHVVSEKPLAMDASETAALVEAAARSGRLAAVNFNHRGYAMVQQARTMISAGLLGDIRLMHGAYLQDWLFHPTDWNWRIDPEQGGASRTVADIGSHWADLVQHVTRHRICRVLASLATLLPTRLRPKGSVLTFSGAAESSDTVEVGVTTEDYGTVIFETEQGARGTFTVSQISGGRKNKLSFEVDGASSSVAWDADAPDYLWFGHRDRPNEHLTRDPSLVAPQVSPYVHLPGGHYEGWPDALKNTMANIYEAIREGRTQPEDSDLFATFEDGHRSTLLVGAILESSRAGRWVEVPAG